jgi:hypothetical protein
MIRAVLQARGYVVSLITGDHRPALDEPIESPEPGLIAFAHHLAQILKTEAVGAGEVDAPEDGLLQIAVTLHTALGLSRRAAQAGPATDSHATGGGNAMMDLR